MKPLLITIIAFFWAIIGFAGQTNDLPTAQQPLFTHAFHVDQAFMPRLQKLLPPQAGESHQELILRYLKVHQLEIKKPASLKLDEEHHMLIVRTSDIDFVKIEPVIAKLQFDN